MILRWVLSSWLDLQSFFLHVLLKMTPFIPLYMFVKICCRLDNLHFVSKGTHSTIWNESEHLTILYTMYQVRVWSIKKMDCTTVSSPTAIRKRITAPNTEYRRSTTHERVTTSWDTIACTSSDGKSPSGSHSPLQPRVLDFGTPESAKKRGFALFQEEALDTRKSPEAQINSPSSVLSPPPSLKRRTIRDYFASSASWFLTLPDK